MVSPHRSRRLAILAIIVVSALVVGGLGVATQQAVQLQRLEALQALERSRDEARALAMSRLDAVITPVLFREQARPVVHFRPYYKPTGAIDERTREDISPVTLVPSPLQTIKGPDWLLLYFQATHTDQGERWSSPQIADEYHYAPPIWALPSVEPAPRVEPASWLETLRERYHPVQLQARLEDSFVVGHMGPPELPTPTTNPATVQPSRSAEEFNRRGARLVQMLNESNPGEMCFPETVAFENLETGRPNGAPEGGGLDCVQVTATPMRPIWLDLTADGRWYLAFMRQVTVETGSFCTLQGVLIDWEKLKGVLEAEVHDLFPNATLIAVTDPASLQQGTAHPQQTAHALMQTIPVEMRTTPAEELPPPPLSTGFKVGLALAWGVTLVALAAIAYGTLKFVTGAERRMRFVSAVTHELRTPLTSFQLYSELLADMPKEDAEVRRRYARTLCGESKRLARLVENVLAYSRMGATMPSLDWHSCRPAELLEAVRSSADEPCRKASKELAVDDRCPEGLRVETDSEFVVQILMSLVENACKYSAEAEDVRIWLCAASGGDGVITFEVDDAGPGVPSSERRAIFEPFRRGNATNVKLAGGVGLGLALARYWAACLGGNLSLRRSSRNNSRYSSFVLTLPTKRS